MLSLFPESGKLFSFGGNEDGQLGHGNRNVSTWSFENSLWFIYNILAK